MVANGIVSSGWRNTSDSLCRSNCLAEVNVMCFTFYGAKLGVSEAGL